MSKLSYCYLGRFQIFQDFKKNIDANIETIESIQIIKYNAIPRSVDKENQLEAVVYGITTVGISWLNNAITKKINTK